MRRLSVPDHSAPMASAADWDTRLLWASLFLCLSLFAQAPNMDLWVSQRYFLPAQGFVGAQWPWVQWIDRWVPSVGYGLLAAGGTVVLLVPVLKRLSPHAGMLTPQRIRHWQRSALGGLLVAALGSGLIVHGGFKTVVGRPRPIETTAFGGSAAFVPAFHLGEDPTHHKSFVSGHATTAFCLMALGLASSTRWRLRWLLIGSVAGSVVGLARVMQGAHFLSDVVFAFHSVWLSCEAVAWLMAKPIFTRWFPQ